MERNQLVEKVVQINQDLCTGCGSCVDLCSVKAIHLVDYQAEIDQDLCIACETCLNACPNGAIITTTLPINATPITIQPLDGSRLDIRQQPPTLPETNVSVRGIKPLTGAALAFLGSEIAPRLVDLAIKSIDRKLTRRTPTSVTSTICPSHDSGLHSRGQHKQIRYRGGRAGNRNYKGRR